jgi:hypothetical protein
VYFAAFKLKLKLDLMTPCFVTLKRLPSPSRKIGKKRALQWRRKKLPLKPKISANLPKDCELDTLVNMDPERELVISTHVQFGFNL